MAIVKLNIHRESERHWRLKLLNLGQGKESSERSGIFVTNKCIFAFVKEDILARRLRLRLGWLGSTIDDPITSSVAGRTSAFLCHTWILLLISFVVIIVLIHFHSACW